MEQSGHTFDPNRVNQRTYRETLRWLTFASLKALAPYVSRDQSTILPNKILLDDKLVYDERFPTFWVSPVQGPLNPVTGNRLGQINGFVQAVKDWRPPASVAALQLDVRYQTSILDGHTYLHLYDANNTEGYLPYIPQMRPHSMSESCS